MISSKLKKLFFAVVSICALSSFSSAKLEQTMLSVDDKDKKVTFTIYHFNATKQVTLTDVAESIGDSVKKLKSKVAISASANTDFSFQSGKFVFPNATNDFIRGGVLVASGKSPRSTKHTFILTDEKGHHAVGYSPNTNESEFGYAIQQYINNSNYKYTRVVIVDSGNQCGFYKSNGKFNDYYLKELKKPAKVITVK